jgi:hypothetical protein
MKYLKNLFWDFYFWIYLLPSNIFMITYIVCKYVRVSNLSRINETLREVDAEFKSWNYLFFHISTGFWILFFYLCFF